MPKTTNQPVAVPSLATANQEYAALIDRRSELQALQHRLDAEWNTLAARLATPRPDRGRGARIGALLGDEVETIGADPATRLADIERELGDIRAAIAELTNRLQVARHAASKTICDGLRDTYRERVAGLAMAVIAAHDAHQRYADLVNDLQAADVSWTGHFPVMTPKRFLGEAQDSQSPLARWLREAAQLGFIPESALPEGFRHG